MSDATKQTAPWRRPAHWPEHWCWIDLPEDDGDPRLLEACWSLMDVTACPPALAERREKRPDVPEVPVLDPDPDLNDLPRDHTQGAAEDPITLVGVVRLAKAVLAVADRMRSDGKPMPTERIPPWKLPLDHPVNLRADITILTRRLDGQAREIAKLKATVYGTR